MRIISWCNSHVTALIAVPGGFGEAHEDHQRVCRLRLGDFLERRDLSPTLRLPLAFTPQRAQLRARMWGSD